MLPRGHNRRMLRALALLVVTAAISSGCASSRSAEGGGAAQVGLASFYSDALAGRPTASGEPYDPGKATCAHRTLPLGTWVQVTVVETRARASCRINDRGPFVKGRIIDVSRSVARQLGMVQRGVVKVRVVTLRLPEKRRRQRV